MTQSVYSRYILMQSLQERYPICRVNNCLISCMQLPMCHAAAHDCMVGQSRQAPPVEMMRQPKGACALQGCEHSCAEDSCTFSLLGDCAKMSRSSLTVCCVRLAQSERSVAGMYKHLGHHTVP